MKSYEFTIVAGGLPIDGDDWHERFYEAGCDDALLMLQRGLFVLRFDREAETLALAVSTACDAVRGAGAQIVRIEPDPLVSASDIADRVGITRQAVSLYVNGERGEGFPSPVAGITGNRPTWRWVAVAEWLHAAEKLDADALEAARLLDNLNASLGTAEVAGLPRRTSPYAEPAYYLRAPIENPVLRTAAARSPDRRRAGFSLRAAPRPASAPRRSVR